MNTAAHSTLIELLTRLVEVTPARSVPYVTLTSNPERPFGAVVIGPAGNLVASYMGQTVAGIVSMIQHALNSQAE